MLRDLGFSDAVFGAAGIALINALGNIAGFSSPFLLGLLTQATGTTEAGMCGIAGIVWLGACLVFLTPARLVNR
nr:hypothetical protein [uncultured Lichenicoccus sp.]